MATSESWKKDGERKERTEWHRVVIFGKTAEIAEKYLSKGSKVYLEGQLETRSWEQDGQKKYSTEIVLRPFKGELTMLDSRQSEPPMQSDMQGMAGSQDNSEIPF